MSTYLVAHKHNTLLRTAQQVPNARRVHLVGVARKLLPRVGSVVGARIGGWQGRCQAQGAAVRAEDDGAGDGRHGDRHGHVRGSPQRGGGGGATAAGWSNGDTGGTGWRRAWRLWRRCHIKSIYLMTDATGKSCSAVPTPRRCSQLGWLVATGGRCQPWGLWLQEVVATNAAANVGQYRHGAYMTRPGREEHRCVIQARQTQTLQPSVSGEPHPALLFVARRTPAQTGPATPGADTTQSSWNSETYAGADDRASRRVHYPRHHHYNAQDRIQS